MEFPLNEYNQSTEEKLLGLENLEKQEGSFQSGNFEQTGKVRKLHKIQENSGNFTGFPLGLENLEKWEGIFQSGKSQGILNRLEKSGKSHKILENSGNLR